MEAVVGDVPTKVMKLAKCSEAARHSSMNASGSTKIVVNKYTQSEPATENK